MYELIRRILIGVVLVVILVKTNPTLEDHRRALYPGLLPSTEIRAEPLGPRFVREPGTSAEVVARRHPDYEPSLTWHDYKIFSTTTDTVHGDRKSFGILGHVFDLRTHDLLQAEEHAIERAHREELAKMMEGIGKPWFSSAPSIDNQVDYASRGCVVGGGAQP